MTTKKQYLLIILLLLILSIAVWFVSMWYRTLYAPMLLVQKHESVKVYPGNTLRDLAKTLHRHQLIDHPDLFIFIASVTGHAQKLRFGEYTVSPGMNASDLLQNIISGRGMVRHKITLIDGWTFRDIKKVLENNPNLFHRLTGKTDATIMAAIGQPKRHPEGLFLPETYLFIWGNTDIEVLQHAYDRMQTYLRKQWLHRAPDLPYKNAYEALIVASLIEKETSLDSERPVVAQVILLRLKKRMRLQVDPTVLYGLNKAYGTRISRQDLLSKTPYNTYQVYGLPPTPIDIPGKASIYAALHPSKTAYLYYVSTGDGHHVFSKTYHEHLHAVKKYRMSQQQRLNGE